MADARYDSIQQFYAEQMQLLDDGATDKWAETFTEDGTFATNAGHPPVTGRGAIAEAAGATAAALARDGLRRRHWIGMLAITGGTDAEAHVRSYALVLQIPRGGTVIPHVSTTCEDVLVAANGGWQVRARTVTRDDL
jgi:3-phenylpropionate/cinnamic acid dioxygenase small subunit